MKYITYKFKNSVLILLPELFKNLIDSIKKSETILELKDNWDNEGSKGYSEDTWKNAILFLCDFAIEFHNKFNFIVDTPKIDRGSNGSIDIMWQMSKYRLIINIEENNMIATYYGDNSNKLIIEGEFNIKDFNIDCFIDLF